MKDMDSLIVLIVGILAAYFFSQMGAWRSSSGYFQRQYEDEQIKFDAYRSGVNESR